jgi:dienelactone hydrolase
MNAATLLLLVTLGAADEDLTVLRPEAGKPAPGQLLELYLKEQCYAALARRRAAYERLKSPEDCLAYQRRLRDFFVRQLGGFPERTPLKAQVVGRLKGDGYRVEKLLYESEPRHHVTALLYLPEGKPPYPAVLVPCGHSLNGKAAETYQRVSILLARNGCAALCYDPIGQGERYQILSDRPQERFRDAPRSKTPHPRAQFSPTTEHTLVGVGSILVGTNAARYRIWDGIRSLDYLAGRPDIDARRLGCTGNSGGGTLTSYLMALDDRVACAAPGCFLTTYRRLIDTVGPQDAEQNIFGQIAFGLDEAEYVLLRAPKPTLLLAGTRDATFDITGTWDVFRDAKRFYGRFGFPERVDLAEADLPHGFSRPLREASVRWMRRWLLGRDEPVTEPDFPILTQDEVQCSPAGQVMLLPGERSVIDLNVAREKQLAEGRRELWAKTSREEVRQRIRDLAGVRPLAALPAPRVSEAGRLERTGYRVEKLVLEPEAGVRLPALAFVPPAPGGEAYLYLHGQSMKADALPGGPIEQLVRQGHLVLAMELRGIGETETGHTKRDYGHGQFGRDVQEIYLAYLLGRSYVGMRTEDVLTGARFLAGYQSADRPRRVRLVGIGEAAIPALHAAALEPDRFAAVELRRMVPSWAEVVRAPVTLDQLVNAVHGALQVYDLPDLMTLWEGGRVVVREPVTALGEPWVKEE